MKKIDFFFWGYQCPINHENIDLLREFQADFQINYYDMSIKPQIAVENNIFFPFLTVFSNGLRWHKPLSREVIKQIQRGEVVVEIPYIIEHGKKRFTGELLELNSSNMHLVLKGCTMNNCMDSCLKKTEFLSGLQDDFYGYLHLDNGRVVGGAEYVPSLLVPYNIPRDDKTAFLTCVYHSSTEFDYKAYPLKKLEDKLSEKYEKIIGISDETGTFPNGNLQWFLEQGYSDEGVICIEKDYCKLHLVSKSLVK